MYFYFVAKIQILKNLRTTTKSNQFSPQSYSTMTFSFLFAFSESKRIILEWKTLLLPGIDLF